MADPRFHAVAGPLSLADLARITGAEARPGDRGEVFRGVGGVGEAGPDEVVFVENRRYLEQLGACKAGACFIHPDALAAAPEGMALLVTRGPQRAFAKAARAFYPIDLAVPGIAGTATIEASAVVHPSCEIGPGAYVAAGAELAEGVVVEANAVVGRNVAIGAATRIGAGATVTHALVGARVLIYAGVRIGQEGFGVVPGREHVKVPQLGRVIIHDDVEIGANTTIDRGALGDTVIGAGCFIDNLVQIGHNVRLGRGCIIAALVGISGSTIIGDYVMIGGQAGFTGHLEIGDGARIGAQSGVMRNVPPGETVGGSPAIPMPEFLRQGAMLRRLMKGKGA